MTRIFSIVLLLLAAMLPAAAQPGPRVHARLVAESATVPPGGTVMVALEEKIAAGWHTYWENPGDAGAPTEIHWTLPSGWKAGAIQWPRPKRLPVGPLMDYGYEGTPWLLIPITAPANAKPGESISIKAAASWLVCQQICVPEDATLTLPLTIGAAAPDPGAAAGFAAARASLPAASPWKMAFALAGDHLDLYAAAPSLAAARPKAADFFPRHAGTIKNAAPQMMGFAQSGLVLRLTPGAKIDKSGLLDGLLVLTSADGSVQALEVRAPPGPVPPASFPAGTAITLGLALLFACLGGIILNIMPCVLPILAMKALALARHTGSARQTVVAETLAYSTGAVVSFLLLGLALVLLRAGGQAVGWGFQMQSPIAVAGFALLVFAVGLNLSGVFEVGSVTAGESLTRKRGTAGAFFTGVLAVAVGAPCTMPFGAVALGFALTQGAATALLIFLALGIGFALPFLILGLVPGALAFVPKPGPWMLRFKQFLAFPMYGAAAWLATVLAAQAGVTGLIFLFAALVIMALAAWLWTATRNLSRRPRRIGTLAVILLLLCAGTAVAQLANAAPRGPSASTGALRNTEPYTAARLAALRAEGRPVFVDVTASWCISCLVNEQTSLARQAVQQAFATRKIAYLVADLTNRNPEGAALLKAHGRAGPPLYLYYAPGAAVPLILPQILTEGGVLGVIGG